MQLRFLGLADYTDTLTAMQHFTRERDADTEDELWLLQHPPVFTQGISGKAEHLLAPGDVPVVQIDRAFQIQPERLESLLAPSLALPHKIKPRT